MNQISLFVAAHVHNEIERRESVLRKVEGQAFRFRPDFAEWLPKNYAIWERFEREANTMYLSGRKHYSARTIGEYLRHTTSLESNDDGEWKLNDHRWPDLARVYLMLYPERDGFFELRGRAA